MFITKLPLNDKRAMVDFYSLHTYVYTLFPVENMYTERTTDQSAGVLYRLERGRVPYVIMQSRVAPMDAFGESKKFSVEFKPDAEYWFRLRGNTTKRRTTDHRRVPLIDPDEQIGWLERKAEENGFVTLTANIVDRPGTLRTEHDGVTVAITPVTFEGQLVVKDVEKFTQAWTYGIGSAKGFGCGLLSLAAL